MKKWLAFALSLVLICLTAVPAFAAPSSIVGELVDSDGEIASDGHGTIRPGSDYYYVIAKSGDGYDSYVDRDLIRFSLKKKEGKKYISDADLIEKKFGSTRYICIKLSVKDNFSDDEYKVVMEANFRAKKELVITNSYNYHAGLEFPKFRPATSSDGSYTPEQIQKARDAYNKAVTDRDALKTYIEKLKKEIAELEKQIGEQNAADKQKESELNAAKQKLDEDQKKLAQLKDAEITANSKWIEAKTALEEAQKAANAANEAAKQAADQAAASRYAAQKAAFDAQMQNAQNAQAAVSSAQNELQSANDRLSAAQTDLANAEALQKALGPQQFEGQKPDNFVPTTLIDRFNALSQDETAISVWNQSLANYTAKQFTQLAADDSNHQTVAAELNAELARVTKLAGDASAAIDQANEQILDAQQKVADLQKQAEDNKSAFDQLTPPQPAPEPTPTADNPTIDPKFQAAVDAAKAALDTASANVAAQEKVVKDAEQKVTDLTSGTSGKEKLEEQLKEKNSLLLSKNNELKDQEKAVTDKKAELDRVSAGTGDNVLKSGETFTHTFKVYIQNENIVDDDATFFAGDKGVVVKPVKNEINTVTWEDHNRTLAVLKFHADSDVSFYCPRLSTRWGHADYLDYFENRDAYLFDFVDSPTIPATTRPLLSLYNPFVNDDDELTVRTSRIHIYEVVSGELEDVTDKFTFEKNDDGDYVMTIKTRTLGTYIVSDGKADIPKKRPSKPSIEAGDHYNRPSGSSGGDSVTSNTKPIPWTGR